MQPTRSKKIRVICPCFNEEEVIEHFYSALAQTLDSITNYKFEIAMIDDGSNDRSLALLNALAQKDSRLKVYSFSRNFGHQSALLAGLDDCHDDIDALIMMDCDLQHPPKYIPMMIAEWEGGADIVSMVRRDNDSTSITKNITSRLFYKIMNRFSRLNLTPGAADFGLLGRAALNAIRAMPERDLFVRGAVAWVGFSRKFIEFEVPPRFAGQSKYTFSKMLHLARMGLFSFSTAPITACFWFGVCVAFAASLHIVYAVTMYVLGRTVPGWTSLISIVVFFGGVNLFTIGIIGEYISRIYDEVKQRPRYLLKQRPLEHSNS